MVKAGDGKPRSDCRVATALIQKRVTPEEKRAFERRAREAGFASASAYLGAFIQGRVGLDLEARRDLRRLVGLAGNLAANVNQIAKRANEGRLRGVGLEEMRTIRTAEHTMRRIAAELRAELRR